METEQDIVGSGSADPVLWFLNTRCAASRLIPRLLVQQWANESGDTYEREAHSGILARA